MADIVDPQVRSRMMSGIRWRNTKPELTVRRQLHARGFRYALRPIALPGRPDVVLSRWRVAVFVHGCFWHYHGCHLSKMPASNRPFWQSKLAANQVRDEIAVLTLVSMGWRVAVVWECALRGASASRGFTAALDDLALWIRREGSDTPTIEIPYSNEIC